MRSVGKLAVVVLLPLVLGAAGCVVVKPYQREALSTPAMTPGDQSAGDHFRQHWQGTREGSTGGFGAAGGGCGCN